MNLSYKETENIHTFLMAPINNGRRAIILLRDISQQKKNQIVFRHL